jgi:hypothetical protein
VVFVLSPPAKQLQVMHGAENPRHQGNDEKDRQNEQNNGEQHLDASLASSSAASFSGITQA